VKCPLKALFLFLSRIEQMHNETGTIAGEQALRGYAGKGVIR
jgi:hypothetical protein